MSGFIKLSDAYEERTILVRADCIIAIDHKEGDEHCTPHTEISLINKTELHVYETAEEVLRLIEESAAKERTSQLGFSGSPVEKASL